MSKISHEDLDRNLAFLAYGLLFFAFFFAGAPALAAVAIAYARRHDAGPLIRGHHAYQIWVFWVSFGFAMLMALSALAAVMVGLVILFRVATDGTPSVDIESFFSQTYAAWSESAVIPLFFAACIVLFFVTAIWLVGASAFGFVRLASGKPIGQTRE